jgi:hypothetical protein
VRRFIALLVVASIAMASSARADVAPGPKDCGGGLGEGDPCVYFGKSGVCRMRDLIHGNGDRYRGLACDTPTDQQIADAERATTVQRLVIAGVVVVVVTMTITAIVFVRRRERRIRQSMTP